MMRQLLGWLIGVLTLTLPSLANAQSCSVSVAAISFGNVSPITLSAVDTMGAVSVTCTWSTVTVTPNVLVCLNLAGTSPRQLKHGTHALQYDLYQDAAHSLAWGSVTTGTTPISLTLTKPSVGTSASQSVTVYGEIAGNQPTVPTVSNSNTSYTHTFSGTQTSLRDRFYSSVAPNCSSLPSAGTFPFSVSATVVNDCNITATNVDFGAATVTTTLLTATGSITAQCTNGDAWRIALSGGSSGNVAARQMQRSGGGGTVNYQLYTNSSHATVWGDGTGGTSMEAGTGSGNPAVLTLYGEVPAQTTPTPGSYSDAITATISF